MDTAVNGTLAPGFEGVGAAFARNFTERGERGAGLVVYRDGHKVVDVYAGTRDVDGRAGTRDADGRAEARDVDEQAGTDGPDGPAPWTSGTGQILRSATKGVAAATLLLLHQRGALDLDAPVAHYWPEFKARGKENALVRHVLAHRAGVPALDRPLTPAEAADHDRAAAAVAAQAPFWEPGTDHGYHAQTYGWLTGELVRRVTGGSLGTFVAQEIAGPARADLWIGLPAARAHRAGRVGPVAPPAVPGAPRSRPKAALREAYTDPRSLTRRAFDTVSPAPDENDPGYRAAELPGSNGIATADGLARFYAALIGEVDGGTRLFTPDTVRLARTEASAGPDRVLAVPSRFGLGYMLHGVASPLLTPHSFGHPGRGGALGFADPETGIAFGYVTNGLGKGVTADPRAQALVRAVREVVSGR
ncbi:serine hydrolase domain-containing protein [Streptomyces sp. NPDC049813]|uniref:serine hydrolase domain-containing protein n=1 Tax=Streptomyces sp. NPDC049813 TaxID=3365597 RepID=UPI00379AA93B